MCERVRARWCDRVRARLHNNSKRHVVGAMCLGWGPSNVRGTLADVCGAGVRAGEGAGAGAGVGAGLGAGAGAGAGARVRERALTC
jgi:hypothetical protein